MCSEKIMMKKRIDNISINGDFWVQLKTHLVSFRFKGLPKGVHFTIGFDKRSSDVNFHVTNNHSNPNDKPQIKIVVIDKNHLEKIAQSFPMILYNLILSPFDFNDLQEKDEFNFIPFNDLESPELSSDVLQDLIDRFKDISRIRKKTRLKIEGDVEKRLESLVYSEDLQKSIQEKVVSFDPTNKTEKNVDGGVLLIENKSIFLIRIFQDWFFFNFDINPFDLLCAYVDPLLAKHLIWKTKKSIVRVKNATNYADTEKFNTPIRLIHKP